MIEAFILHSCPLKGNGLALHLLNSRYSPSQKQLERYPPCPKNHSQPPAGAWHHPPVPHRLLGQKLLDAYTHSWEAFLFFAFIFRGFILLPPRSTCCAARSAPRHPRAPSLPLPPPLQSPSLLSPLPVGSVPAVPCPAARHPAPGTASSAAVRDRLPWRLWAAAAGGAGSQRRDTQQGSGPCSPRGHRGAARRCARAWAAPAWPRRSSPPLSPVVFGWENAVSLNLQRICQYKSLR